MAGTASGAGAGVEGDAVGDLVEPAGEGLAAADGAGAASEGEERGLEGVLGLVGIAEDATADVQHHFPVAPHEQFKGGLVVAVVEPFQELSVGHAGQPPGGGRAQTMDEPL
jgi:hypothetical protein